MYGLGEYFRLLDLVSLVLSLLVPSQAPKRTGNVRHDGDVGREVAALLVFTLALGTVDPLFRHGIANRLE